MTAVNPEGRAPVALFTYARPEHTRRTLEALAAADGATETDVFVYADGARGPQDADRVEATREVARKATGFRSLTLIGRDSNVGVAANIVSGISNMFEEHDGVIVVEDDILVARGFLDYMNVALCRYRNEKRVWHISGWNYPIEPTGLPQFFFWRVMNCWGWATWSDRWNCFSNDPDPLHRWPRPKVRSFNIDGYHDFFAQIADHECGLTDAWDIYWYATIFENDGLCLQPTRSFVQNIGLDGSGEHCGRGSEAQIDLKMPFDGVLRLPPVEINAEAVDRIKQHLWRPWYRRLLLRRRLRRVRQFWHR